MEYDYDSVVRTYAVLIFVFYLLSILPEKFNTFRFPTVVHLLVVSVYFYSLVN